MTDPAPELNAFVIMPFDADFTPVYEDLIEEPLRDAGWRVTRADTLLNQRSILADVVTGIAHADLVVADVTGLNPNVMYELGLAHALGKRTVMITQNISELPFDLRPYRANAYTTNFRGAPELASFIRGIAQEVASGTADFSNPVQDYAPETLALSAQVSAPPRSTHTTRRDTQAGDGDDAAEAVDPRDLEFLDGLEVLQEGAEQVNDVSTRISERTGAVGSLFRQASKKIETIRKNLGNDRALQPTLVVMRDTAKELETYADDVSVLNHELRDSLDGAVAGANAVARFRQRPDADLALLRREHDSLDQLVQTLAQSYASTSNFAASIGSLPPLESSLRQAAARASGVVADTASILETAQAEFDRVRAVMKERLEG
ncbi:nucleoside 2-deoxyribosyltransferase [Microbacterium proteolyticum]|uniref:nucleoside 2-deoxyribosyltransferase n=1 Tax=Microbacterium proteolyticum TaxID=1572644 RepID=UPI001FAB6DAA|nr:nucleoside 2-deoxyribosyltransferase [Microbacterium proteolyticum]MCI9856783.1 hypothetical protein [Microbacterium proteolyticum]